MGRAGSLLLSLGVILADQPAPALARSAFGGPWATEPWECFPGNPPARITGDTISFGDAPDSSLSCAERRQPRAMQYAYRSLVPAPVGYVYRFHVVADFWTQDAWRIGPDGCPAGSGDKVFVNIMGGRYCLAPVGPEAAPTCCPRPSSLHGKTCIWTHRDEGSTTPAECTSERGDPRDQPRHVQWSGTVDAPANLRGGVVNAGLDTFHATTDRPPLNGSGDEMRPTWGSLTVTASIVPLQPLVVYLSRDCDNPLNDPVGDCDDATWEDAEWIPRGRDALGDGSVWLVAQWFDPVTRPANATFSLASSAWLGHAMNYPQRGASEAEVNAPDVAFAGSPTAAFDARGIAKVKLTVTDWAARGEATVVAGGVTKFLSFPVDYRPAHSGGTEGNHIPDAAWAPADDKGKGAKYSESADPELILDACSDLDGEPAGNGVVGDGFSAWDEYRGVVIAGEHRRLDPRRKDVFLAVQDWPESWNTFDAMGFIQRTELRLHRARVDPHPHTGEFDIDPGSHVVARYRRACGAAWGSVNQKAFVAKSAVAPDEWTLRPLGYTTPLCTPRSLSCPPQVTWIFRAEIEEATDPDHQAGVPNPSNDSLGVRMVVAHEFGHALNAMHYCWRCQPGPGESPARCIDPSENTECRPAERCADNPTTTTCDCSGAPTGSCGPESVMANGLWWAEPKSEPVWWNIPDGFQSWDTRQMQVRSAP